MADQPKGEVPRLGTPLAESISQAVQKALDAMEPGQRGAVDVRLTMAEAEATILIRVKDLSIGAHVLHEWHGDTQAGGRIIWRF